MSCLVEVPCTHVSILLGVYQWPSGAHYKVSASTSEREIVSTRGHEMMSILPRQQRQNPTTSSFNHKRDKGG
jgi:hypothetical protein